MKFTLDIPDELVPVVSEILTHSSRPGWEEGEGSCTPNFIMKTLNITPEQYRDGARALTEFQDQLDEATRKLQKR